MIVLAALLFALAVAALALWLIGGEEPVYRLREARWFIAVRGETPPLPHGARLVWSAAADFPLIGAEDAYWSRFLLVAGDAPPNMAACDDAYVARLRMFAPPRMALGLLRVLIATGVLTRPETGDVAADAQQLGFRADVMPGAGAIANLLARADDYAPAMVNFLSYYDAARDGQGTGAAAYRRYGMVAMRTVYRTGGHLLFYGAVEEVVRVARAGPTMGVWNDIAAMRYPNPRAILSMEHVPEYRAALKHRDAGLDRTVVIASTESA